jgi:hypothetical protein
VVFTPLLLTSIPAIANSINHLAVLTTAALGFALHYVILENLV